MRGKRLVISMLALILVLGYLSGHGWAFWIWTPKTQRWVNPKHTVKETPEAQLEVVEELFEGQDYKSALNEAKKLIRYYSGSREAAEAQFYIAACLEKMDKLYEAHQAYQRVVNKYPFSQRTDEIVERQFKIAELLLEKAEYKVLGISVSYETVALEIFGKVIDNSPYSKFAPAAQYKIGLILKGLKSYAEAKQEFQKVIDNYPQSQWVEAARFQIASCGSLASLRADYDQTQTEEAKQGFQDFVREHPDMEVELSQNIQDNLDTLSEKEAEANLKVAQFYERQQAYESAKIYYRYVITNFPDTASALSATQGLRNLERQ